METSRHETIFVWRHRTQIEASGSWHTLLPHHERGTIICPYCFTRVNVRTRDNGWEDYWEHNCPFCGFNIRSAETFGGGWHNTLSVAYLREFDLNSSEITLPELNTHLKRNFSDISTLSPYKFEQSVGDIYKNIGYKVLHTARTRDGGYDLCLVGDGDSTPTIVECKRYNTGKISVAIVRQLVGVQLINNFNNAILITNSYFSNDAKKEAAKLIKRDGGYNLDLVDADGLLKLLNIYNENLPPRRITDTVRLKRIHTDISLGH